MLKRDLQNGEAIRLRKIWIAVLIVLMSFGYQTQIWGKRFAHPIVASVFWKGIEFRTSHGQGDGYVEAVDTKSGKKLWGKLVYKTPFHRGQEWDNQSVYVKSLYLDENKKLIIINEKEILFLLDPLTGKILSANNEDLYEWENCKKHWGRELITPNFFVNHLLFFPNRDIARKAASKIEHLGFSSTILPPDGSGVNGKFVSGVDDKKEWKCHVSKNMVPNFEAIKLDKQKLKGIIQQYEGCYKGWSLEWNGDNP
jgi:hypothetical protein